MASLLLAPLGPETVLHHVCSWLRTVTGAPPIVVTPFEIDLSYEQAVREACPDLESVMTVPDFAERCHGYESSDRLLLVDPTCFPLDAQDPTIRRLSAGDEPRGVTHLVALARGRGGTTEFVNADSSGRIRTVQRYYDAVTWTVTAGVAASLVPVSCLRVSHEPPLGSLPQLRRALAAAGVPSRDVALEGGGVNLGTERGLLAINERQVLALVRRAPLREGRRSSLISHPGARIHPSARIVGPVVVHDGVEVEPETTIIGPSVLGSGCVVGAGATVAQCVVGPGQRVEGGQVLRHRVYLGPPAGGAECRDEDHGAPDSSGDDWETSPLSLTEPVEGGLYPGVKRAMDVVIAGTTLLLIAPLGLAIAALIKLESRGPVHFGHLREGRGGRPFRCWKFRTMIPDADQQQRKLAQLNQVDGPQFKVARDPRRTRVGRILTATNLDEIPQLWNVLVGDMSLVGPRPSPFRENQVCVPWREGRLSVRPGVTGLWQICRHDRHKADFHQWIYYDLLYVRHQSFWLDAKIVALTALSFARGGYIPLSWLLAPGLYGERRSNHRGPAPSVRREKVGPAREERRRNTASGPVSG